MERPNLPSSVYTGDQDGGTKGGSNSAAVPVVYQIAQWSTFERSDLKKTHRWSWLAVPNKHDGKGYRRLISRSDGAALFGAWNALIQVASKMPVRGVLADEYGPLTAEDLQLKTGIPATLFQTLLELCSDKSFRIEWIIASEWNGLPVTSPPDGIRMHPDKSGRVRTTEQNRTVQDNKPASQVSGEPPKAASPENRAEDVFLVFECVGGKQKGALTWSLTRKALADLAESFPALNAEQTALAAHAWCKANPTNRKTASGMLGFLTKWFIREQNKAPPRRHAGMPAQARAPRDYAEMSRNVERQLVQR